MSQRHCAEMIELPPRVNKWDKSEVVLDSLKESQHHNQKILGTEYQLVTVLCSFGIILLIITLSSIYKQFHINPN